MVDRDEFGPLLRRERESRGMTLDEIAAVTKVSADLWVGLECNDFSRWPSGIFARAFVRDYARAIGLDADAVVNDFCRLFPLGDRRAARIMQAQAELIGHTFQAMPASEPLPAGRDRRANRPPASPAPGHATYTPRIVAASLDLACVSGLAFGGAALFRGSYWAALGVAGVLYYAGSTVVAGGSPGSRVIGMVRHRAPSLFTSRRAVNA